eukprot:GFUD01029472.1.p1 GENE.GFUD01029472.1~~GFUD01029472.1.p1  ORF type:complete len:448 (+),score=137.62 GFUD01029472.1:36-1379(+)
MEKVSLNCSCMLLGDFRTSPRTMFISDRGWSMDVNSADNRFSFDLEITQADILKTFGFLGKEKSYIFINLNEKKCLNIQNNLKMTESGYKLDIKSASECQRRVVLVLDAVVDVCHNILRQRFKYFHELKDEVAAENLFKYACKKRSPVKRKMHSPKQRVEDEVGPSKRPKTTMRTESEVSLDRATSFKQSRGRDDYTSDLSFELSRKQITNQALNMELDLKKKKQDILSIRDDYYAEKEEIDDKVKSLEKKIDVKEHLIRNVAFPKINAEIHELERRINGLKQEKKEHLEELQDINDSLHEVSNRKLGLKKKYCNHIKLEHDRLSEIKSNLAKLKSAELILNKKDNNEDDIAKYEQFSAQIQKYEQKLECPVCLETCQQPIFQCHESHIICNACRSRVKRCPQCLVTFEKRKQRHRYAEEDAEELLKLYKEREAVFNNIHERENKKI